VRASQLFDAGVHPRTLYALRDAGQLELVSRGLYRLASAPVPPHLDLLVVASHAPHAVVCLISALAFHELTDEVPHEVLIAVRRERRRRSSTYRPCASFSFRMPRTAWALSTTKSKVSTSKSTAPPSRSSTRSGSATASARDVAIKALTSALRSRRVRPGPLLEVAGKLRARRVIESPTSRRWHDGAQEPRCLDPRALFVNMPQPMVRPFDEVLTYFAIRAVSIPAVEDAASRPLRPQGCPHAATLGARRSPRATRDIDLLGRGNPTPIEIAAVIADCIADTTRRTDLRFNVYQGWRDP
jgi:hypothetical protein